VILRTELRRSTAPVLGLGLAVVSLVLLYSLSGPWEKRTAPWDEQWIGLAQWTRYLAVFLLPLVLGAGAWQGLRDRRSGVLELFGSTPRTAWRRTIPLAGALGIALTGGYLVVLVVGGVQVAGHASYFPLSWLPVAGVMVLGLTGFALLGAGIGRLVPSLVTPPLLAVAALGAQVVLAQSRWPLLLTPAFDGIDISLFNSVAVPVTLTQAVWFVGIGVTGFGLLFATTARSRVAALLPIAVAAGVTLPVLSTVDRPVVADADARALVCDEDGPRVCVTRAHADALPAIIGPAREALALMEKLPSPPTSAVEAVPDEDLRVPSGATPVFLPRRPSSDAELRLRILAGVGAPVCSLEAMKAQVLVASWLTGDLVTVPGLDFVRSSGESDIEDAWQALNALPPAEQASRVATLRHAALFCTGEVPL
jgi:hypothetical protein